MFDLIIMLSRYLFIFYIVLFLWQGIVYVAYEQGGFLGNPYTAVSMQRRITVLMHMTAFLILGYNRETYMFDIGLDVNITEYSGSGPSEDDYYVLSTYGWSYREKISPKFKDYYLTAMKFEQAATNNVVDYGKVAKNFDTKEM